MSQMPGLGSGFDRGGGSGGSIRESGGSIGQREYVLEEMYFRDLTALQLEHLRDYHLDELHHLEKSVKLTQELCDKQKEKLDNLKKLSKLLK